MTTTFPTTTSDDSIHIECAEFDCTLEGRGGNLNSPVVAGDTLLNQAMIHFGRKQHENETHNGAAQNGRRGGSFFVIGSEHERICSVILIFGAGFDKSSITLRTGSLLLDLGSGDAIHIENWDQANPLGVQSVESFQFADGSSLSWSELLARGFDLDGSEGDDIIVGTGLTDRIRGQGGDDVSPVGASDTLLNVTPTSLRIETSQIVSAANDASFESQLNGSAA